MNELARPTTGRTEFHPLDAIRQHVATVLSRAGGDAGLATAIRDLVSQDLSVKGRASALPVLPLLTCELVGGEPRSAVPVASAWNLLHLSARVFDDLQDGDALESLIAAYGPGPAMNIALALVFLAELALDGSEGGASSSRPEMRYELNRLGLRACMGQHRDLTEAATQAFTLDDYWNVVAAKSGECFAWACRMGALAGGGSAEGIASCGEYGYNLGILLQIADDSAALRPEARTDDLARGQRTLPVLYALTVAPPPQRKRLTELLSEARRCPEAKIEIRQELIGLGALGYLLVKAEVYRRRALAALASLPACPARDRLNTFLNQLFPLLPGGSQVDDPQHPALTNARLATLA